MICVKLINSPEEIDEKIKDLRGNKLGAASGNEIGQRWMSQGISTHNKGAYAAATRGSDTMHIQYLYTLQFLEFDIKHLEKAVSSYKQTCKDRMDQGVKGAWVEHRDMEMIEQKILDAKRKAHRSGDAYLE